MAPAVGFEPTTNRLTVDRSTTELRWIFPFIPRKSKADYLRLKLTGLMRVDLILVFHPCVQAEKNIL